MKMVKLMATRSHKYGTRQLTAGDEYEAPQMEAVAHVAKRKARFAKPGEVKPPEIKPPPPPTERVYASELAEAESSETSLDSLRLEATQLGINVDGRWGMSRLQHEIDEARRR
jgi:hypothetical protein